MYNEILKHWLDRPQKIPDDVCFSLALAKYRHLRQIKNNKNAQPLIVILICCETL